MPYRYWCGECGFKTPWLTEPQGQQLQIEHYAKRHPGIPPGGQVEVRRRKPDGRLGCVRLVVAALLLLMLAASCHSLRHPAGVNSGPDSARCFSSHTVDCPQPVGAWPRPLST